MGLRTFIDADGIAWSVWDVYPQLAERRRGARRVVPPRVVPGLRDQRAGVERRRRNEVRVAVRDGYERGWLTFNSVLGSRRLAPIPPQWDELPDDNLMALCRQGVEASRVRRRLIE